eukprot:CAMPEP_0116876478 /NCGR_PEP_ID=MMETSP0463-20121206/8406_1 /TAXON_ID=181622 /ORGANISM="Strombidinopsis sp, Strain SopsisLIS2011" /LENGTH=167 /DNA_ID=CAMNT_0004523095 /DNA_START=47 /DNA_END=550 /DNA_ORIENTATION=-
MDDEIKKTLGRTLLLPPLAVCFAFTLSYTIVFKMQLDDLDALTEQGQICYGYTSGSIVNVNDKWHTLLNWGYIFNLIMTIIYGIGCIGAAFGILAAALGSLCCHAFASCVQFAFFITMAVWRYNSWGSACADNSAISGVGNSIQNIFISLCVFNVLSCFTSKSAQST